MNIDEITEEDHKARSRFIRRLVQSPIDSDINSTIYTKKIPKKLVQFWDRLDRLPSDVKECIDSWNKIEGQDFERLLFDKQQARYFILNRLGTRYLQAFDKCYHPAMQSDYFRLCYIFVEGGCYIDTDDVYSGKQIQHLFTDGRLKLQPLCYDTVTNTMIPPQFFLKMGENSESWIFYFNNNPLIACSGHPLIKHALAQATLILEQETNNLPEIQSTTGPGNLSKSIFDVVTDNPIMEHTLFILYNWGNIAKSKWELSYRNDARNWRNSDCQFYKEYCSTK